jgi:transcriptional regulator with GAF, ATPase, and Fis domain
MRAWGVVSQLAGRGARAVGDRVLDTLLAVTRTEGAALFRREQGRLALFAIRHLTQSAVDLVHETWSSDHASALQAGEIFQGRRGLAHFAMVPVLSGRRFIGLIYTECATPFTEDDRMALAELAQIAVAPLVSGDPEIDLGACVARTPPNDIAREQLLVLLEQTEWNISRTARHLRVTRPTVYSWLSRYGIERRRVTRAGVAGFKRQPA